MNTVHYLVAGIMYIAEIFYIFFYYVALKKAGKHMEDSMVASYVALFLGCLAKDNTVC